MVPADAITGRCDLYAPSYKLWSRILGIYMPSFTLRHTCQLWRNLWISGKTLIMRLLKWDICLWSVFSNPLILPNRTKSLQTDTPVTALLHFRSSKQGQFWEIALNLNVHDRMFMTFGYHIQSLLSFFSFGVEEESSDTIGVVPWVAFVAPVYDPFWLYHLFLIPPYYRTRCLADIHSTYCANAPRRWPMFAYLAFSVCRTPLISEPRNRFPAPLILL